MINKNQLEQEKSLECYAGLVGQKKHWILAEWRDLLSLIVGVLSVQYRIYNNEV